MLVSSDFLGDVGGELVVARRTVVHERMPDADQEPRAVSFETAYGPGVMVGVDGYCKFSTSTAS